METTDTLTQEQRDILSHALGGDYPRKIKRGRGFRNYYASELNDRDCLDLVDRGYLSVGRTFNDGECRYWYVTEAGAAAVGLKLPKADT